VTTTPGDVASDDAASPLPAPEGPIVELRGVHKRYGATVALDGVDLVLRRGEVHALVGANGAGKSTLIKVLAGGVAPDTGEVRVTGTPLALGDPAASRAAGIWTVHQDIDAGILPGHTVAENLTLDRLADRDTGLLMRPAATKAAAARIADRAGLTIGLDVTVDRLGSSDRQQIVLARALGRDPRLLILDEPTSALSARETGRLFATIRRMVGAGVAVLYVSHRLPEVAELAARVTVLRGGRVVAAMTGPFSAAAIGEAMLGHAVARPKSAPTARADRPMLTLTGVRTRADREPLDLEVHEGEIVGLFGLVGAGKSALLEGLFGARPFLEGRIRLAGAGYEPGSSHDAVRAGVHLVPEDRGRHGVLASWSVARNLSLPFLARTQRFGLLDQRAERRGAVSVIERFGIVTPGPDAPVATLSGGNQQKVVVGRWLVPEARVLLLDEPFAGVDLGARADIGERLRATALGRATIVASADIDELLEVADRIVVLRDGAVVLDRPAGTVVREVCVGAAAGAVAA
jgi:simple sugar transport system ATP-binding protein